jgi:hypothetical protein
MGKFTPSRTKIADLEVDGTTIVVDEVNDRVGIGIAVPSHPLEVYNEGHGDVRHFKLNYETDDTFEINVGAGTAFFTGSTSVIRMAHTIQFNPPYTPVGRQWIRCDNNGATYEMKDNVRRKIYLNSSGSSDGSPEIALTSTGADTTTIACTSEDGLTIKSATPNAAGPGIGSRLSGSHIAKINGEIISTYMVDLEGMGCNGTVAHVIGDGANSSITQLTNANNGFIYKIEMICVEIPDGTNVPKDIDLAINSSAIASGSAGSTVILETNADFDKYGKRKESADMADLTAIGDSKFLYLVDGNGVETGGVYTQGKFVIKLYGYNF